MHWLERRRARKRCFHHDHRTGQSWMRSWIIDWRKLWVCNECGKRWVI